MNPEKSIRLTQVSACLVFDVNNEESVTVPISTTEDLEHCLDLYRNEQWAALFEGEPVDPYDITVVKLDGLEIIGQDEHGNRVRLGLDARDLPFGTIELSIRHLEARNAQVIQQIRDLLDAKGK